MSAWVATSYGQMAHDDRGALLALAAQAQRDAEAVARLRTSGQEAVMLRERAIEQEHALRLAAEQAVARLREENERLAIDSRIIAEDSVRMIEQEREVRAAAEQRGRQLEAALRRVMGATEPLVCAQLHGNRGVHTLGCRCGCVLCNTRADALDVARAALAQPTDAAPACWWAAPTACPRHGASVFLCPAAPPAKAR